jgi:HK97 family phage portal protein
MTTARSYWTGTFQSRDPLLGSELGYGPTSSGVSVTPESAFNSSAFWSAVSIIAADVASLPLELIKRSKDGTTSAFTDSKTYELMHDNPNPEMTSMVLRETLQAHALTWGGGYAEIERNGGGQPLAIWPLTPDRVAPFRNAGRVQYRIANVNKPDTILDASDILHVPGLGFDGVIGYSVLEKARDSIGMGLAMQRFGGSFFGNGSTFGGILTHPQKLTKDVKQGIRESIEAVHAGVDRAHKFVILGDGMTYTKLGIPPDDAQFLESRRFEIEEIARWFHMPQHKLNGLDHATFSNIEHLDLEYFKSCLRGWLVRWEQELNRKLVPSLERKTQYFKHNVEGFLRGDSAARADYQVKMFQIGGLSINEIRELNDQNGIGEEGDAHFVPANLMPVDRALNPPAPPQPARHQPPRRMMARSTPRRRAPTRRKRSPSRPGRRPITNARSASLRKLPARNPPKRSSGCARPNRPRTDRATQAVTEADALRANARELQAAHDAAVAARDEMIAQAQAAAEAAAALRSEHQAAVAAAEREREATALALADAATARAQALAAETAIEVHRAAERARLVGMLTAHRALIVDAMGRMVRRETEKARRHQATPAKLRAWAELFYATHAEICVEALRPAIRVHLAWKQSADDVETVTSSFVQDHIAESVRQLHAAIDGHDGEELSAVLDRMLTRWEQHRPEAFADRILREEVEHVTRH